MEGSSSQYYKQGDDVKKYAMEQCQQCGELVEPLIFSCKNGCVRNFLNEYGFSMSLMNRQSENSTTYDTLDIEVRSFFESTRGPICNSTFDLVINKGMGKGDNAFKGEIILCEEVEMSQLKRLYNFLDLVLHKSKLP